MGIWLQLSMPMPFQLWALIYSLYGSQLIPKKKALLHICISQVITPTYLQILSQSNKWLLFEYISLIQNVIKITEAYYVLKAVCVYYIYMKTVMSRIIPFARQKAREDQSILPAYGIRCVIVLHLGVPAYLLNFFTYNALCICLPLCKHMNDKAAAPGNLYLDSRTTKRLIVQVLMRANNKSGLQGKVVY